MFNDPKINELIKQNEQKMKDYLSILDALSADIKKMESILYNSAIPESFYILRFNPTEKISWKSGRIMFESDEINRPLIETPKEIRLKCKPHLYDFLQQCLIELGE